MTKVSAQNNVPSESPPEEDPNITRLKMFDTATERIAVKIEKGSLREELERKKDPSTAKAIVEENVQIAEQQRNTVQHQLEQIATAEFYPDGTLKSISGPVSEIRKMLS
jgi:hypothetical protein